MDKKIEKLIHKQCIICDEDNYNVLDLHRIKFGGKYTKNNTVVLCCSCHRKVHSGQIVIDKKYNSTKGTVLHYFIGEKEYYK